MNGACSRCSLACQGQDSEESSGGFGKKCGVLFLSCGVGPHPLNCCPLSGSLIGQPLGRPSFCPAVSLHLRDGPKVRFVRFESLRVLCFSLIVGHRSRDYDVLSWFPVNRRGDILSGGQLQRIQHTHDLVEIAAGGCVSLWGRATSSPSGQLSVSRETTPILARCHAGAFTKRSCEVCLRRKV
jgi:hypothetical protein